MNMAEAHSSADPDIANGPPRLIVTSRALYPVRDLLADSERILIHCDGACEPNPGPGGWGAIIDSPVCGRVQLFGGWTETTTNNRMELTAAIVALAVLPEGASVTVVSDSQYVVNGASIWSSRRRRRMTLGRALVPNNDLWIHLDTQLAVRDVAWQWVRSHSGHEQNELADSLAVLGLKAMAGLR